MAIKDVSASKLIPVLKEELKKSIKQPEWSLYIKTGSNTERPPTQNDWWHIRLSALLRKIALNGPVGVQRLRTAYGGKKRRGVKPPHQRKAGGKIIRVMLQQLEQSGLIKKTDKPKKGRILTSKGQKLLERMIKKAK